MRTDQCAPGVGVSFPMWAMPGTGFGLGFAVKNTVEADEPKEKILALGLAYRESALASPALYPVMFGRPFPEFERDDTDRRTARKTLERLRVAVTDLHEAGQLNEDAAPENTTVQLWALMHGLALLELRGEFDHVPPAVANWTVPINALLAGRN